MTITQQILSSHISTWDKRQVDMIWLMVNKYGLPQEICEDSVTWHKNGIWKRTVIHKYSIPHNMPNPHRDFIANTIDYKVPVKFHSTLIEFDGSIYPDRTAGELTVKCHGEEPNTLIFNLAHEIMTGVKTVKQAREFAGKTAEDAFKRHIKSPYMTQLMFKPEFFTADPDSAEVII